ncbi:chorion class B protein Ld34-like isoform X9 [Spodoptera frugiperda]|uniref:Chorion class B protein Ld34-like isoform X5 n=1 Tax=Spodoptera frugiperda TaxID=7108 RepID=A0A9R0E4B7_SPOFR|nr:chorion class B protein Ld34-like isoform X5 [Spodoptera frugiperda]XP_050558509.1 chorion class B protein Ld34-like isoform X6 [Spodoptera frugiperda]XP_050558510.1 chorion class B protein Ld34-like isoform X7 [Spodoptera frugiperda]XP_050558511.1 chorion class B protein Ld34-like isoform X8 [Spodoptera frugiperda]XP_050558512.1 chorion class B protein Ld34-like isoform X9 [Spodoptera frugiperda]
MSVKAILVLCAQALLVKSALSQACGYAAPVLATPYGLAAPVLATPCGLAASELVAPWAGLGAAGLATPYGLAGRGLAYDALIGGAPAMEFSPTSGGGLPVTSGSAIAPVGISVASDNVYEGALEVIGELPFVGTVAMEGVVPSAGAGAINHACGNGRTAMASGSAAYAPGAAYAPAAALAPLGAYGPAGAFAPAALAAPGLGLRGDLIGRGCGCGWAI